MADAKKGIVFRRFFFVAAACAALFVCVAPATADESVLVYPSSLTIFHYNIDRYELITSAHQGFDAAFAIGNQVLWDKIDNRIPLEVYRAPGLAGFVPSATGVSEYETLQNEFKVTVDGYCDAPRHLGNLYMRFVPYPASSNVQIELGGQLLDGLTAKIADFSVQTPTGDGHFSDTRLHHVRWSGAIGLRIIVFSDKNFNGVFDDGPPLFCVLASDNTVPVRETTWGALKTKFFGTE